MCVFLTLYPNFDRVMNSENPKLTKINLYTKLFLINDVCCTLVLSKRKNISKKSLNAQYYDIHVFVCKPQIIIVPENHGNGHCMMTLLLILSKEISE